MKLTLLDDCLGWGSLLALILQVAERVTSPISSNEVAISEIRHISAKKMNVSQSCFQNMSYTHSKISATSYMWDDLMPSFLQQYLWISTQANKLYLFLPELCKYGLVRTKSPTRSSQSAYK